MVTSFCENCHPVSDFTEPYPSRALGRSVDVVEGFFVFQFGYIKVYSVLVYLSSMS